MTDCSPFDMRDRPQRSFSMAFLFVLPFIVLAFVPKVKYFVPYRFVGIFVVMLIAASVLNLLGKRHNIYESAFWWGSFSIIAYKLLIVVLRSLSGVTTTTLDTAVLIELVLAFAPMVLLHYAYMNGRKRELLLCVCLIIGCITYGSISTITAETGMGRVLAMGAIEGDIANAYDRAEAILQGTLGYGLTYASVIILTALFYKFWSFRKIFWPLLLVEIALLAFGVVRAAFSIAVLQMALSMGLVLVAKCLPYKVFKPLAIIVCLVVALGTSFPSVFSCFQEPLYDLADAVDVPAYQKRLRSVADTIAGSEDSYAWERTELYRQSCRIFLEYPIFGCCVYHWLAGDGDRVGNDSWTGGHSFVFDGLGASGILGFSVCVFGVWCMIKYLFWLFDRFGDGPDSKKGWLCCFLPHVIVAVVNTSGTYEIITALFLVAPAIFLMFPKRHYWAMRRYY